MCGVIGIFYKQPKEEDLQIVRSVFLETQIRGLHATGFSYVKENKIQTIKDAVSAEKFLEDKNFEDYLNEDGNLYLVGHCRYSTSDLRYNQPIANSFISVVHNGVVSQEDPSHWKYETETKNDSELILRSLEEEKNPIEDFPDSSQAVCVLWRNMQGSPTVMGYRNGKRPLWYSKKAEKYLIFTSTEDIAKRANLENTKKCKVNTYYTHNKDVFIIDDRTMATISKEDIQP